MTERRLIVAVLLLWAPAVVLLGCGDDDEKGGAEARGTCDLRAVSHKCIELHDASSIDFENQKDGCNENDGEWSTDACPSEELIGCCDYEFGNTFRECFYTGITSDYEAYCRDTVDGVFTPAT
jgi:hypothetical protein